LNDWKSDPHRVVKREAADDQVTFTLFGNQNSGHSYKVALFLTLAGIPYQYRHVSLALAVKPSDWQQ
jgi:hypothetical protein